MPSAGREWGAVTEVEYTDAFDPRRAAILLIAGDKTRDRRFYERMTPIADRLYDEHLEQLKREGLS
jgi:hypothetical protein